MEARVPSSLMFCMMVHPVFLENAAIMADAFRKMLRKPDFAAIGEGDGPESQAEGGPSTGQEVLNRELAEEGRDLRSVASSRGVTVESHSHHGEDPHQR